MPLYEQHRSLTAAAWRSVVLERFLRSQSAPAIAKLQVRRTRSEKVQTGGDGVQGALEGANRVVGDMVRCKGATNIIHAACALLRSILLFGSLPFGDCWILSCSPTTPISGLNMIELRTSMKPCFVDTVSTNTVRKLVQVSRTL